MTVEEVPSPVKLMGSECIVHLCITASKDWFDVTAEPGTTGRMSSGDSTVFIICYDNSSFPAIEQWWFIASSCEEWLTTTWFEEFEKIKGSIIIIFTILNCGTHNLSTKAIKSEIGVMFPNKTYTSVWLNLLKHIKIYSYSMPVMLIATSSGDAIRLYTVQTLIFIER